jgi:hypothetical protein
MIDIDDHPEVGSEIAGMIEAKTKTQSARPAPRRQPLAPWMEAILTDWRKRWPAAFTKPVPLAAGFSGHIKGGASRRGFGTIAEGHRLDDPSMDASGGVLYAVMRGEMRRNLDGSEAGVPDDEPRQQAKQLLAERAARRAVKERQRQAKQQAAAATSPAQAAHAASS